MDPGSLTACVRLPLVSQKVTCPRPSSSSATCSPQKLLHLSRPHPRPSGAHPPAHRLCVFPWQPARASQRELFEGRAPPGSHGGVGGRGAWALSRVPMTSFVPEDSLKTGKLRHGGGTSHTAAIRGDGAAQQHPHPLLGKWKCPWDRPASDRPSEWGRGAGLALPLPPHPERPRWGWLLRSGWAAASPS